MTRERLAFGHGAHRPVVSSRAAATSAAVLQEPQPVKLSRIETWDWAWGGLLIFTILLFLRPQDHFPFLKNSHVSDIAAFIGLAAMVALNASRGRAFTRMTPELGGVLLFGLVILATVPTSVWPGGAFAVLKDIYLPLALIYMLMTNALTSPKRIERIVWVIVIAFGYMSVRVIFNYLRGIGLVEGGRAAGPVGGFFQNPNDLALNLAAFLPLVFMCVKRPGPAARRLLCAGIALAMMMALVFTKSRGGTVGLVAMLITFVIVARMLTPAKILTGIVVGMLILPALPDHFWSRMSSIADAKQDETGSREERRKLLEQGVEVFLERPLTGVGAGQFQSYWRPGLFTKWHEVHNVLLQVATEMGIFGLLVFSFLIYRGFSAAWWTRRRLLWIVRRRPGRRDTGDPEDGLDDYERAFLYTHATAMVACMAGWFVCALFASVALNWTFYYVLALSVSSRDVVRARAAAYARAKAQALREAAAA